MYKFLYHLAMNNEPLTNYERFADKYAEAVDNKPIHVYYERPGTWSLLPKNLTNLQILDLGCGSGWYAEQLSKAGGVVTAIDVSARMVELTRKRLQDKAKVICANLEKPLDFLPDNSFDLIVAPLVIHYLPDLHALMKELARLLKSKGLFVFSTHEPHSGFYLWKLKNYFEFQVIEDYWPSINQTVKFYHQSLSEITESLYEAGFLIERMIEPLPQEGLKQDPKLYPLISTHPWFLFVRAIKK